MKYMKYMRGLSTPICIFDMNGTRHQSEQIQMYVRHDQYFTCNSGHKDVRYMLLLSQHDQYSVDNAVVTSS